MSGSLLNRLSSLFRSSLVTPRRPRGTHRVPVESLEHRCLLSASPRVKAFELADEGVVKESASWSLRLTEPVTGLDSSDFQVTAYDGVSWQSVSVMGNGQEWIVTVEGLTGKGYLRVNLIDDGSIRDTDGNPLFGSSGISFQQMYESGTAVNYQHLLASDFDGDGRDEVVYVESSPGGGPMRMVRMDMDANGTPSTTVIPLLVTNYVPIRTLAADITGDGRKELLVAEAGGVFEVFSLEASGATLTMFSGGLPAENGAPVWYNPGGAVFADFTNDGLTDMAVEYNSLNVRGVQILQGNHEGQFFTAQFIPLVESQFSAGIRTLLSEDLNNDGLTDLLFDEYMLDQQDNLIGRSRVFLGTASGELVEAGVYPGRDNKAGTGRLFDMDGDQIIDWIGFDADLGLCVFPGLGDGSFGTPMPVGFSGPDRVSLSPFELVVESDTGPLAHLVLFSEITDGNSGGTTLNQTRVTRFRQTTPGHYELSSELDVEGRVIPLRKSNLQEGLSSQHGLELRLTTQNSVKPYRTSTFNRITIAGELPLSSTFVTALPGLLVQSADGDFDGDGVTDTVVTTANAGTAFDATDLTILLRNPVEQTESPIRQTIILSEPEGNEPTFVLAADANSDGQLDVLSVGPTANTLNFHRGLGEGLFAPNQRLPVGAGPVSVTVGDFNFDGFSDVVTANSLDDSLSLYYGTVGGILERQNDLLVGVNPQSVLTADFNQDEYPDVIVALAGENSVAILYGTADGVFSAPEKTLLDLSPSQLAVADLNSDGLPDVIAAGVEMPLVQILFGSATGLQTGGTIQLSGGVRNLLLDDLNLDGKADLMLMLDVSKQVLIANGLGSGEFSAPEFILSYYSGTDQIALGELNGAGPDLISLSAYFSSFFDFRTAIAPGIYTSAGERRVDHSPRAFAVADFTGDGRDDLVAADFYKDGLRLFRNLANGAATGPWVRVVENLPPTNDVIGDIVIPEDTQEIRVPLTGISPGVGEEQLVRVWVYYSDNPGLIPDPTFVQSDDLMSGEFIVRPNSFKSGSATVYYYLEDAGPDGDFATWEDNGYSTEYQEFRIFVTAIRPTIYTPNGALSWQRPEFYWSEVSGAVEYRVWISNTSTGQNPQVLTTVPYNLYVPEMDLGIGRYEFWVQAVKADGKRLPWSLRQSFEIDTQVTLPELPRRVANPRLPVAWAAIPGADAYEVYLSNLSTGQSGVIRDIVTTNSWEPTVDLGLARWRIWVRALVRGKYQAWWSNPADFTVVAPPVPAGPLVFTAEPQPVFQWSGVAGADRYGLQLRNAVTGKVVIDVRGLTSPTFTPLSPVANGRYRWWAIAESTVTGIRSDWSVGVDLIISDRPVLLSPSGSVSSQNLKLTWMAFPNAVSYEVWVTRMQPLQFIVSAANITQTEWSVPVSLLPGTPHRFWIRAVTSDNRTTAWSQYLEFSVAGTNSLRVTDEASLALLANPLEALDGPAQLAAMLRSERVLRHESQQSFVSTESRFADSAWTGNESDLLNTATVATGHAMVIRDPNTEAASPEQEVSPFVLDQAILLAITDLDRPV